MLYFTYMKLYLSIK